MKEVLKRLKKVCLVFLRMTCRAYERADTMEGTAVYVDLRTVGACFQVLHAQCGVLEKRLAGRRGNPDAQLKTALAAYWRAAKALFSSCRLNEGLEFPELPLLEPDKDIAGHEQLRELLALYTRELRIALERHEASFRKVNELADL